MIGFTLDENVFDIVRIGFTLDENKQLETAALKSLAARVNDTDTVETLSRHAVTM